MDENALTEAAAALRSSLQAEPLQGSKALIGFAHEHAVTAGLRHNALILKLSYIRADQQSQRDALLAEMLALVDEIIEDHRVYADSEKAQRFREARERIQLHYSSVEPPQEVVFGCTGLGKTYKKSGFTLDDVNMTLRRGEITGVVGENANGKTTLFRMVAGELKHDEGHLSFPTLSHNGEGIDWAAVREEIAYVPQELPKWYGSLLQNIQYAASLHGIRGTENREEVDFIIERMGLQEHLGKSWNQLSGGFKLRFSLARALVWKPKLLLLDEPLGNLDFKAQLVVLRDLQDLAGSLRYPMAVLISSQHLHEVEAVADDILFLHQGEVVYNGSIDDLGTARKYNTFELGVEASEKTLIEALADFSYKQLYHSGLSFVLTTPLQVKGNDLVQKLVEEGIQIEYFRDISGSIKQLFN